MPPTKVESSSPSDEVMEQERDRNPVEEEDDDEAEVVDPSKSAYGFVCHNNAEVNQ